MVEYANQLGRPHFEVCVVKRVVSAMHQTVDANYLTSFVKIIHT